jgi:hypothetical protein
MATLALGAGAVAGPEWCEEDPVFMVNGALLDVTTSFPWEEADKVKEVEFELLVPVNVVADVVSLPSRVPTTATITYSLPAYWGVGELPVIVRVTVKASGEFDILTRVTGTYASAEPVGLGLDGATRPEAVVSFEPGKSNVATQVSYSLLGL